METKAFSHYRCFLLFNPYVPWACTRMPGHYWRIEEVWIMPGGKESIVGGWSDRVFLNDAERVLFEKVKV